MRMKYLLEVLFPCIVILYLIDCIAYVKKDHFLLVANFGKRFKVKRPGIRLTGILPTAKAVVLNNIKVCFSKIAIYLLEDDSPSSNLISEISHYNSLEYKDIAEVGTDGKDVTINGEKLIKTQSPIIARQLSKLVESLKISDPFERGKKIKGFLEKTINLEEIRLINSSHQKIFFWLEISCILLFAFCFIELPILLYSNLFPFSTVYILLSYIAILYVVVIVLSILAERRIYQNRRKGSFALLSLILSPVNAINAVGSFTRDIYAEFDYLAVAAELLPRNSFKVLIGTELARVSNLRDLTHNSDLEEYWQIKEQCLHNLLAKVGVPLEEILTAPQKRDTSAETYCPVCNAEYRSGFNNCSDCGVPLKAYDDG
jgi:hypothetical protein